MWDNSCLAASALQPPTLNAPATFLPYCAEWVINTTDKVWLPDRTPEQVTEALHEHFYVDWESTSNGKTFRGMHALESLVTSTRNAFPDLKIHITDVVCVGNDIDGYKTIMPDVLVGTHLGPSALFGPPTGKTATWSGMAFCYVQKVDGRWQYVAEWVVHDELSAAMQLGLAPNAALTVAETHDCTPNLPSWGWRPPSSSIVALAEPEEEAAALKETHHTASDVHPTPAAKAVVEAMDAIIAQHIATYDWEAWRVAMAPFWAEDFVYDSTIGTGVTKGLRPWFFGEHVTWNDAFSPVHFTQLVFAGEDLTATTTTYATVTWRGPFGGIAPSNRSHRIRICDFYHMEAGPKGTPPRIRTNYMMLDVADLLRAAGKRVLPHSPSLPDDGLFLPPRSMEGVPMPLSAFTPPETREATRKVALELLKREWGYSTGVDAAGDFTGSSTRSLWHADTMIFYGPSGIGTARGYEQYEAHVLHTLQTAFTDAHFELDVLACEGSVCGAHGQLKATHRGCYLGAYPTEESQQVSMRLGLHWHVVDGLALDGYMMHDAPALFKDHFGGVDLFERANTGGPLPPPCPGSPAPAVEFSVYAGYGAACALGFALTAYFAFKRLQLSWALEQERSLEAPLLN